MPGFSEALIAAARGELARFGGRKETDEEALPFLLDYWGAVPGFASRPGKPSKAALAEIRDRTAWSAAFISFAVRAALTASGNEAPFAFSASHSVYAGAAIRNDFNAAAAPSFHGLPPRGAGAERPRPGDILGVTRTKAIADYEDALRAARKLPKPDTYFSHFDVVVGSTGGKLSLIGGNVSNSVTQTEVRLDPEGFPPIKPFTFDSAGAVLSGPYICLIRLME